MSFSARERAAQRELKEFRKAEEDRIKAEQARIEEKRLAPVRQLEQELTANARKLRALEKEAALNGLDDHPFVDPITPSLAFRLEDVRKYNAEQYQAYRQLHPHFYPSEKNIETIGNYFEKHRVDIVTVRSLESAVNRLNELGMLEAKPEPTEPKLTYEPTEPVFDHKAEEAKRQAQEAERRRKYATEPVVMDSMGVQYTQAQLDAMDSESYRRVVFGKTGIPVFSDVIRPEMTQKREFGNRS